MAVLKLLRNQTLYATHDAALTAIDKMADNLHDGELWVATYGTSPNAKSILALKRTDGLTIFDNETSSDAITAVINALDATVKDGLDSVDDTQVAKGKHVGVKVVETDGVLTSISVVEDDIASKKALDDEIAAREAADTTLTNNLAAEVTRAKLAETSIDSVVGLTKAVNGETRTFTPTSNYGNGTATVMANMQAIDTKLQEVETKVAGVQYKVYDTTLEFFGIEPKA